MNVFFLDYDSDQGSRDSFVHFWFCTFETGFIVGLNALYNLSVHRLYL